MSDDLSGEIELANGETVEIPRTDKVQPTFGAVDTELDISIEDGRVAMFERGIDTTATLAGPVRSIDDPNAVATIFAGISTTTGDDRYAEFALTSFDQVRELRDALNILLKYHGED